MSSCGHCNLGMITYNQIRLLPCLPPHLDCVGGRAGDSRLEHAGPPIFFLYPPHGNAGSPEDVSARQYLELLNVKKKKKLNNTKLKRLVVWVLGLIHIGVLKHTPV